MLEEGKGMERKGFLNQYENWVGCSLKTKTKWLYNKLPVLLINLLSCFYLFKVCTPILELKKVFEDVRKLPY
jgi:hypothetical protein